MKTRFTRFISLVLKITLFFVIIGAVIYLLQSFFHLFDSQLAYINTYISEVNGKLSKEILTGISVGTLILVLGVAFLPLLFKKIQKRAYLKSLQRGVISSFVFFISTVIYEYAEKINHFYLLLAIVLVIIVTFILIEALSLAMREEEEKEFRTEIVASIASGLLFSVLLKLVIIGIEILKKTL